MKIIAHEDYCELVIGKPCELFDREGRTDTGVLYLRRCADGHTPQHAGPGGDDRRAWRD